MTGTYAVSFLAHIDVLSDNITCLFIPIYITYSPTYPPVEKDDKHHYYQ